MKTDPKSIASAGKDLPATVIQSTSSEAESHNGADPQEFAELSHVTNWEGLAADTSARAADAKTEHPLADVTGTPGSGTSPSLANSISSVAKNPSIWGGIGATTVCIGSSLIGVIGQGLATLWTIRNTLQSQQTSPALQSEHRSGAAESPQSTSGYRGLALDGLKCRGFNMILGSVLYAFSVVEAAARGHLAEAVAFGTFIVGFGAAAYLANLESRGRRTDKTLLERVWTNTWEALPERFRNLLRNPSLWFASGNMLLVLSNLDYASLVSKPLVSALVSVGVAMGSIAVVRGLLPLFSGREGEKPTGTASYLTGITSSLLGTASILSGSAVVGIANLCWGVQNALIGWALNRARRK